MLGWDVHARLCWDGKVDGKVDMRFLFGMYIDEHEWWTGAVFLRRFLVPVCIQAFSFHDPVSTLCLFGILVASVMLTAFFRPYNRARDSVLDCMSQLCLVVTYFLVSLRQSDPTFGGGQMSSDNTL
jgi:hypothetical protein